MKLYSKIVIISIIGVSVTSCFKYSFTGASIEAETIFVDFFENEATLVVPSLSQEFTESLKDKFVRETSLKFTNTDAELILEGAITNYFVQPNAFQGNETAATNRLSITVQVLFTNTLKEEDNFQQFFTRYADFDSSLDLAQVESQLIEEINEQLIDDIFNKAVVNW